MIRKAPSPSIATGEKEVDLIPTTLGLSGDVFSHVRDLRHLSSISQPDGRVEISGSTRENANQPMPTFVEEMNRRNPETED